jgi:Cu-processing system permease protein
MIGKILSVGSVVVRELYRRKDAYVLFILTALLTLMAGSVTFFDDDRIVRYIKEISLLLIWISMLVLAVTMAARHIPMERESRTLLPLLAKPITRAEVLLGKFWGCWLACGIALAVFYSFFGTLCLVREHEWRVLQYVQAMVLHWLMTGIVIAMALFGSLIFAAPSSTNTIVLVVCGGILLLGRHLGKVAMQLPEPQQTLLYGLYFVIPHLEFFDLRNLIIHDWPLVPWHIAALAALYACCYIGLFLALATLAFRRKSVA